MTELHELTTVFVNIFLFEAVLFGSFLFISAIHHQHNEIRDGHFRFTTDNSLTPLHNVRADKFPTELEEKAWKCVKEENLDEFKEVVLSEEFKNEHHDYFPSREIIWISLRYSEETKIHGFLELIFLNFDVNGIIRGNNTALHYAASSHNLPMLKYLIEKKANIAQKNADGDTALHSILHRCAGCYEPCQPHKECFEYLMSCCQLSDVNILNNDNLTPLSFAMKNEQLPNMNTYVQLLREFEKCNTEKLFKQFFKAKTDQEFLQALKENQNVCKTENLNDTTIKGYTLLEFACKKGMIESAKYLIEVGADINYNASSKPIELACKKGHLEILKLLFSKNADVKPNEHNQTLLHACICRRRTSKNSSECLEYLLSSTELKNQINYQDFLGRTPLHYAVRKENQDCVCKLLDYGAEIDIPDKLNHKPINDMPYDILKTYLDSKVSEGLPFFRKRRGSSPGSDDHHRNRTTRKAMYNNPHDIVLNYKNVLRKCENGDDTIYSFPTNLLQEIIKSKQVRVLITHPVLSTIIFLKWYRIRPLFYAHLIMYIFFCLLYTYSILRVADFLHLRNSPSLNDTVLWMDVLLMTPIIILYLVLAILLLFEIAKLSRGWKYFIDLDNVMRAVVLILAIVISILGVNPSLSAFSILVSWFELFLVVGKHPSLTYYVNTFRNASKGLLKFLSVHFLLLIAFALSFYVLFHDVDDLYENPGIAMFRTIVMITNEFDAKDMKFDHHPGVSHVIFVVFIFIVATVLVNIMIGLVSYETRKVEENPFLYKCMAQVDIVSNFEKTYFESKNWLHRFIQKVFLFRYFDIITWNDESQPYIVKIDVKNGFIKNTRNCQNEPGKSENSENVLENLDFESLNPKKWRKENRSSKRIDNTIIRQAQKIIANKKYGDNNEIKEGFRTLTNKLTKLEENFMELKEQLKQLVEYR